MTVICRNVAIQDFVNTLADVSTKHLGSSDRAKQFVIEAFKKLLQSNKPEIADFQKTILTALNQKGTISPREQYALAVFVDSYYKSIQRQ